MSVPDVSTIIPTFRRPDLLLESMRSALDQQGVSVEVLVVDDSAEGSALEAVDSFRDHRIRYLKRAAPSGGRPALVRNDGWPQTSGRYIHFLDDDDIVVSGAYRAHVDALDARPARAMSFGVIEPIGAEGAALERERRFWRVAAARARLAMRLGRLGVVAMLFEATLFQNSACMVRRTALEATGGFDPTFDMMEEMELHRRTIRNGGCVFVDRPVVRYRLTTTSLIHAGENAWRVPRAYRLANCKYRTAHGAAEYFALRVLGKTAVAVSALGA